MAGTTEHRIEERLKAAVQARGGLALKWVSPGWAGAPDRIVLLPGGRILFVELKRPGGRPRVLQEYRARQLAALGFAVRTVSTQEELERCLQDL
ncbi:MAG: VRR-NUC domain-containing protein [Bacillota bacterium]